MLRKSRFIDSRIQLSEMTSEQAVALPENLDLRRADVEQASLCVCDYYTQNLSTFNKQIRQCERKQSCKYDDQ
jgi:hypothetical protein